MVLSIFSRFAFIFGHFAFLCGRLHLYLVILWIILVFWFFHKEMQFCISLCSLIAVLHFTLVGLRLFHVASLCALLHLCGHFASLSSLFCLFYMFVLLCLFLVMLHLFLVILCLLVVNFSYIHFFLTCFASHSNWFTSFVGHVTCFFCHFASFCECLFLFMMSLFLSVTFCRWRPGPLNNPPMTASSCFSLVFFLSADMPENHYTSLMWTPTSYPIILLHSLRPSPGSVIFVLHHQRMPSYTRKICAKINAISELGKHLCAVVAVLF